MAKYFLRILECDIKSILHGVGISKIDVSKRMFGGKMNANLIYTVQEYTKVKLSLLSIINEKLI